MKTRPKRLTQEKIRKIVKEPDLQRGISLIEKFSRIPLFQCRLSLCPVRKFEEAKDIICRTAYPASKCSGVREEPTDEERIRRRHVSFLLG